MGAMTKGSGLGLCWGLYAVVACGGTEAEAPAVAAPPPETTRTSFSEDGLFSARWVDGAGELRLTRWAEAEPGCRSASYQLEVINPSAGASLELGYDRRNVEVRLLLGWARTDGATQERLTEPTPSGPGVIRVGPSPSARYCAVGPQPLMAVPDPASAQAPLGSGRVFALNSWRFAEAGQGLEEGTSCGAADPCSENLLGYLGVLRNHQIRQEVLGGALLQLVELVGLDTTHGRDPQWVLKSYLARDADDPISPGNNFRHVPGLEGCCEFLAAPRSLEAGQARAVAGAVFDEGLAITAEDSTYELVLEIEDDPFGSVLTISKVRWRFWLHSDPPTIEGRLTGVASISELAAEPYVSCRWSANCGWGSAVTWLDHIATRVGPDRDLDGDGLESVYDVDGDGLIDRCCDGPREPDGACRPGEEVPAVWLEDPGSCALQPEMADGYSLTMAFGGVPAQLVGVANER
jgi:hypothetical protein